MLPPDFAPQLLMRPGALEVWTPKVIQPHEQRIRGSAWWKVVARLRRGVSVDQAAAELTAISAALAGVAAGVAAAAAASRALAALLFEVRPSDPATLAPVSGLLIAVGIAACDVPARRATRVDPLIALRADP